MQVRCTITGFIYRLQSLFLRSTRVRRQSSSITVTLLASFKTCLQMARCTVSVLQEAEHPTQAGYTVTCPVKSIQSPGNGQDSAATRKLVDFNRQLGKSRSLASGRALHCRTFVYVFDWASACSKPSRMQGIFYELNYPAYPDATDTLYFSLTLLIFTVNNLIRLMFWTF